MHYYKISKASTVTIAALQTPSIGRFQGLPHSPVKNGEYYLYSSGTGSSTGALFLEAIPLLLSSPAISFMPRTSFAGASYLSFPPASGTGWLLLLFFVPFRLVRMKNNAAPKIIGTPTPMPTPSPIFSLAGMSLELDEEELGPLEEVEPAGFVEVAYKSDGTGME
ncbi:hypothetical protein N7478_013365 [Penicillium angulare]|uniref:uncharacterized protein n=1 Tax=Penicillium angulare TaxID=116970 RepID=UPI0025406EF6|nr:uncharacterized protein N7478_013365 [Penicillium angulare]KAJ5257261.1 hypothetical protein N7478_013365 [Penicillium angulare]